MARIRSIHPGLWTDETYVTLSPFARLLFLGIWNECDDMGSFEWSPIKLKMRLLPADSVDAVALLDELAEARCIMSYEAGGKRYGAVRNFCQYQRPKKPNTVYPLTEAVRDWVNIKARSTRDGGEGYTPSAKSNGEAVGNQSPTGGEKSRQMKEEGGRRETTTDKPVVVAPRKRAASKPPVDIPEWMPAEAWRAFVEMRKAMAPKVPFTDGAERGIVRDLTEFHEAGHDIAPIIMKSVKNGYRGVFAPEHLPAPSGRNSVAAVEDQARALSSATAERYRRMAIPGPPTDQTKQDERV